MNEVDQLIEKTKISIGTELEATLAKIWNLCFQTPFKLLFGNPEKGFIPLLMTIIRSQPDYIVTPALGTIWYMSRAHVNRLYFASEQLGLIYLLAPMVDIRNRHCEVVIKIISNCTIHPDTHNFLLSDDIGYIRSLKPILINESIERFPFQAFHCICVTLPRKLAHILFDYNIPLLIINYLLKNGPNPIDWANPGSGSQYFALNVIANFTTLLSDYDERDSFYSSTSSGTSSSYYLNGFYEQIPPGFENYLLAMIKFDCMEGVKALIIYINLYSCYYHRCHYSSSSSFTSPDENMIAKLIQKYPKKFYVLLDVIAMGINQASNTQIAQLTYYRYAYGILRLRTILFTFRSIYLELTRNEENSHSVASPTSIPIPTFLRFAELKNFLTLTFPIFYTQSLEILRLFIENAPEPSKLFDIAIEFAGGGGKDFDSIEFLLEVYVFLLPLQSELRGFLSLREEEPLPLPIPKKEEDSSKSLKFPNNPVVQERLSYTSQSLNLVFLREKMEKLLELDYQQRQIPIKIKELAQVVYSLLTLNK
jgi:hypothetical protein